MTRMTTLMPLAFFISTFPVMQRMPGRPFQ